MEELIINGNKKLHGEISIHGSKNSVLPILAASVLINGKSIIHNCPNLSDVEAAVKILKSLGCKVKREGHTLLIDSTDIVSSEISDSLMREMRSSIIFLGAILGRTGKAVLSTPGGCEIGLRPIDMHLNAVRQLGGEYKTQYGRLYFTSPNGLKGAKITLPFSSVGATENSIIASCTARGTTVINNAACEPEIVDLANFLNSSGAKIIGAGESTIFIEGVEKLHSTVHTVIPDRIAAVSYLLAGAVTSSKIKINKVVPSHIGVTIPMFREMGCDISIGKKSVTINAPKRLNRIKLVRTMTYPGFPTDAQAPLCTALCIANGTSVIIENIFESRFKYVGELIRLGAKINVEGRMAVIEGVDYLTGAELVCPDLRGGFALVLGALSARGESRISELKHIDRGYESPEILLENLGADIKRIKKDG